ncbi:MAG: hypothetical protein OES46_01255 [Gammaproteobacteria bacterium]|jgi:hypothetical protein|nr:hypothetical protein [Gammaproteobacteria bacterium]
MNYVFYLFVVSVGLITALAAISIWSPRPLWVKVGALTIAALLLPAAYVSLVELLSRPKPIALEWGHGDLSEAVVLHADWREGESIYLWLRVPGIDDPRAYVLPWDQKQAEQLFAAQREAESRRTEVHVERPFGRGEEESQQPVFYAVPQPAPPPKVRPVNNTFIYQP